MNNNIDKISELSTKIIKMAELGMDTSALQQMLNRMMQQAVAMPEAVAGDAEPVVEPASEPEPIEPGHLHKLGYYYGDFAAGKIDCVKSEEEFSDDDMYGCLYHLNNDTTINSVKYKLVPCKD